MMAYDIYISQRGSYYHTEVRTCYNNRYVSHDYGAPPAPGLDAGVQWALEVLHDSSPVRDAWFIKDERQLLTPFDPLAYLPVT